MLDKRCLSVLEYLDKECLNCGYKVFSIDEMIDYMPKEYGFDKENLIECLKTLSQNGYISVKYIDDKDVCLTPLPKGRLVFENRLDNEIEKERSKKKYFLYSFIGACLGSLVSSVILFLILFFIKVI